jgi:hypothetical protein
MDWRLKALAFRALDLPGGAHAHYFLQRHVTRNWPRRPSTLDSLAKIAQRTFDDYQRHANSHPETVLEIGAGRDLAVPLALIALGVKKVITTDVKPIAKIDLIAHAAAKLLPGATIRSWADLEKTGIFYLAPHRIVASDEKVQCSCSNEVLEHIPEEQLVTLLSALRATTTGITTHSIDYSDHYARSDGHVSRFNFLRFSDADWSKYNSGMQYVNRLRHSDYLRLFRQAGFTILEESSTLADPPADLPIADQFRNYAPADLFALRGRVVAA